MGIVRWYQGLIDGLLAFFLERFGLPELAPQWRLLYEIGISLLLVFMIAEVGLRIYEAVKKRRNKRSLLEDERIIEPKLKKPGFIDTIEAAHHLTGTIQPLLRAKKYDRVADVYASFNMHKEAGKYYQKAGDPKRAAVELAKAGETLKAAKLLVKAEDYVTAARFYSEAGKHEAAGDALRESGDLPAAAAAYFRAERYPKAAECFADYFEEAGEAAQSQLTAADACLRMIETEAIQENVNADFLKTLGETLAGVFEQAQRPDLAQRARAV